VCWWCVWDGGGGCLCVVDVVVVVALSRSHFHSQAAHKKRQHEFKRDADRRARILQKSQMYSLMTMAQFTGSLQHDTFV
jgi:phosphatidylserine/phosphatidylglycerophosphate/cardiolipin synthase-like enzyme